VRSQQYRFDNNGALFDMLTDPGQKKNVADEKSEVAKRLSEAVAAWRKDVFMNSSVSTKGNDRKKKSSDASQGEAADNRPFPVGYPEFPRAPLPTRDGVPHGNVQRSANAPNCSYFVHWTSLDDSMTWDVAAATTGDYAVEILYTCPESDAGSKIELSFNGSKLNGKVSPGFESPLYTNQDTIPRPVGESRMKEFRTLNLGTMRLEKGRGLLTLRALEIAGKSVMDVRQVTLTLRR
jgi:hypothetical protein